MHGYLILEIDLSDEPSEPVFPEILAAAKAALGETAFERVTHIHGALGTEGLRESFDYLTNRETP